MTTPASLELTAQLALGAWEVALESGDEWEMAAAAVRLEEASDVLRDAGHSGPSVLQVCVNGGRFAISSTDLTAHFDNISRHVREYHGATVEVVRVMGW